MQRIRGAIRSRLPSRVRHGRRKNLLPTLLLLGLVGGCSRHEPYSPRSLRSERSLSAEDQRFEKITQEHLAFVKRLESLERNQIRPLFEERFKIMEGYASQGRGNWAIHSHKDKNIRSPQCTYCFANEHVILVGSLYSEHSEINTDLLRILTSNIEWINLRFQNDLLWMEQ